MANKVYTDADIYKLAVGDKIYNSTKSGREYVDTIVDVRAHGKFFVNVLNVYNDVISAGNTSSINEYLEQLNDGYISKIEKANASSVPSSQVYTEADIDALQVGDTITYEYEGVRMADIILEINPTNFKVSEWNSKTNKVENTHTSKVFLKRCVKDDEIVSIDKKGRRAQAAAATITMADIDSLDIGDSIYYINIGERTGSKTHWVETITSFKNKEDVLVGISNLSTPKPTVTNGRDSKISFFRLLLQKGLVEKIVKANGYTMVIDTNSTDNRKQVIQDILIKWNKDNGKWYFDVPYEKGNPPSDVQIAQFYNAMTKNEKGGEHYDYEQTSDNYGQYIRVSWQSKQLPKWDTVKAVKEVLERLGIIPKLASGVGLSGTALGIKLSDFDDLVTGDIIETENMEGLSEIWSFHVDRVVEKGSDLKILALFKTNMNQDAPNFQLSGSMLQNLLDRAQVDIIKTKSVETPKSTGFTSKNEEMQKLKKSIGQLMILKSTMLPIEFEKKIVISQKIAERQKRINEINFEMIEESMGGADIFDRLFEQSFVHVKNEYVDVFSTSRDLETFFAPNGEPSIYSDSINELVRTPTFKEWFGDWQLRYIYKDTDALEIDCSKVLTNNGEPQIVWHGTGGEFSYFKFDTFPVAYFAVNQAYSQWFADLHGGDKGYTIPFFLNIKNPLDLSHFNTREIRPKEFFTYIFLKTGMDMAFLEVNPIFADPKTPPQEIWVYIRNNPKMLQKLTEGGVYDGIRFYETNPSNPIGHPAHDTEVYVIFNANQAKLADPNRGELLLASLKSFLLKRGGVV
jgi:hypothetical protein